MEILIDEAAIGDIEWIQVGRQFLLPTTDRSDGDLLGRTVEHFQEMRLRLVNEYSGRFC